MFRVIKSGIYCIVFMLCIFVSHWPILAHISDLLTNYLWIKHAGVLGSDVLG